MTKIERVVVSPPAALLTCPADPPRPPGFNTRTASQDDVVPQFEAALAAGRACRDQLDAVRRFVEETRPQEPGP